MQLKSFWQRLMIKLTSLIFHQSVPTTVTQCTLPDARDIIDKTILRTRKIRKKRGAQKLEEDKDRERRALKNSSPICLPSWSRKISEEEEQESRSSIGGRYQLIGQLPL